MTKDPSVAEQEEQARPPANEQDRPSPPHSEKADERQSSQQAETNGASAEPILNLGLLERLGPPPMVRYAKAVWRITKEVLVGWQSTNESRLAAALAFYALFSMAPGLLIVIAVASAVIGEPAAREETLSYLASFMGERAASFILALSDRANQEISGGVGTLIGLGTLFFAASILFAELRNALNEIWNVDLTSERVITAFLRNRLVAGVMVLGIGLILGLGVAANAILSGIGGVLSESLQVPAIGLRLIALAFTFGLTMLLYAVTFKFLPQAYVAWGDVWVGALVTAVLTSIGNYLIGLYLGRSGLVSVYGAAGALVVVLLWVFYSFRVFLLGAKFTEVYSRQLGSRAGRID